MLCYSIMKEASFGSNNVKSMLNVRYKISREEYIYSFSIIISAIDSVHTAQRCHSKIKLYNECLILLHFQGQNKL